MADDDTNSEPSTFSYLWYTAIWYLVQFFVITTLHFLHKKELNKKVVQRSTTDTLLLAAVFLTLQYSQRFLSCAIYRLPYVIIHLFVDLIPTALWLGGSELMLLSCLGLAQQLYNHLTGTKANISFIDSHHNMTYFTSIFSSQGKLEDAIRKHIAKQFPKLSQKLEQNVAGTPALTVLFMSASLLLQLSTLGLGFVRAFWTTAKTGLVRVDILRIY